MKLCGIQKTQLWTTWTPHRWKTFGILVQFQRICDAVINVADRADNPSRFTEPHNKKPRLLARCNSEETSNEFALLLACFRPWLGLNV